MPYRASRKASLFLARRTGKRKPSFVACALPLCLYSSRKMACNKSPTWFLNLVILTVALSLPFVLSSSSSFPHGTNMAGKLPKQVAIFGNEASVGIVEESARQVPTGPDPLHHHNNPIRP